MSRPFNPAKFPPTSQKSRSEPENSLFGMENLHVFYGLIPGDPDEARVQQLSLLLTEDERLKFGFFSRPRPKLHFLFSRLILRLALKRIDPAVLPDLSFSESGQPYFGDQPDLGVSLSHSGEMVACALARGTRTGVDIQQIAPVEWDHYLHAFQPQEWDFIKNAPAPLIAFYQLWARKEAVAKADGAGMGLPFDTLDVLQESIRVEEHVWTCADLELGGGYAGAVAWDSLSGIRDFKLELVDLAHPDV